MTTIVPIPPGYVTALVTYAEVFGANGAQQIKDELQLLFARMQAEEGKAVVNSSVNGKSFGFEVTMSVEQKFTAFARAYNLITGDAGSSPITFPDFSQMT